MIRWRTLRFVLLGAVLLTGGLALAQDEEEAEQTGDEEGEVDVRRRAALTPEEQVAEGERINTRGTQLSRRLQTMLDEARRERDIILVTCLDDKLTQVNANLRTLVQRLESHRAALDGGDPGRRDHEFTVITVLGQKFDVLEQEANQCLGQDVFETGATRVTSVIDPDVPVEDPAVVPMPAPDPVPYIPPPASPAI
jgi:hypothetical protein